MRRKNKKISSREIIGIILFPIIGVILFLGIFGIAMTKAWCIETTDKFYMILIVAFIIVYHQWQYFNYWRKRLRKSG